MSDLGQEARGSGRRRGLGRGLSSLIPETSVDIRSGSGHEGRSLPIERLKPSPLQPRRRFSEDELNGLAESIRAKGIMQPLLVRAASDGSADYEIIAGERRWRAAQLAGIHELPVIVRDLSDRETLEVALLENIQREDLSPLEEAEAYQRLIDEFGHTQQELADTLGKSRSHIANLLRLLGLPKEVRAMVENDQLSAGHARALLNADDPLALAKTVINRGLNVRQTEMMVRLRKGGDALRPSTPSMPLVKDPDTLALERELSASLGLRVALSSKGKGGSLIISYRSLDQLDELLERLR
ncbi:MAG: ParB/RepB/Spo0J family partition protein [Alphaproteobacteria bacterium]|nr:ParB/RepB/Spo0J family partition protein [Alphaproteobacteria bacterium]